MMKNIYFNTAWLLLAALCVGITGCKKELEPIVANGEPAYISLSTKALGLGDSRINTVRVILINPAANHIVERNEFVGSPDEPLIIPVKTGTYDVYVVANEEADNRENTALSNVSNLPTLRAVSLPFLLTNRDFTNLPMFGAVKRVKITAPSGEPSHTNLASVSIGGVDQGQKLPVALERMASKVSVKIISSSKLVQYADIENLPNVIPLFEDVLLSVFNKQIMMLASNLFTFTESTTDQAGHILECKDILIPSWIFADATNISKAIPFEFTIDGKSFSIELGHIISGATKDYTIKRNGHYKITITVKDKMIFTVVDLKSWIPKDDDFEVK